MNYCDVRVAVRGILNSLLPIDYKAGRSLSKRGRLLFGKGCVLDLNFLMRSSSPGFPGRYSLFWHTWCTSNDFFFPNQSRFHIFGLKFPLNDSNETSFSKVD